jgi:hypothetical protein
MQTPAEFKIDLFASEPDIVKPISFNFDERGRLWVIEAIDYPNDVLHAGTRTRSHQDLRGHERRRPRGQVHDLRRRPEPARRASCSPTAA